MSVVDRTMNKYLGGVLLVVVAAAILAPAVVLAPVVGVTDLVIELAVLVVGFVILPKVAWSAKVGIVVVAAVFFTFPPVPNYLWVTDTGAHIQGIGLTNMIGHPVDGLERFLFYVACWLAVAKLTEKKLSGGQSNK
jgi:hypothetical protein